MPPDGDGTVNPSRLDTEASTLASGAANAAACKSSAPKPAIVQARPAAAASHGVSSSVVTNRSSATRLQRSSGDRQIPAAGSLKVAWPISETIEGPVPTTTAAP